MAYILESEAEFERLERQSTNPAYDFRRELAELNFADGNRILDAGCGSGVVTRYLGRQFPEAAIYGCELSADRLDMAKQTATEANVSFTCASIAQMPFKDNYFDTVISRYVFQHLSPELMADALEEFRRVLKPAGKLILIDGDGLFVNLFPQSVVVAKGLERMSASGMVDFSVGRKLPSLMQEAGFRNIDWRLHTADHNPELRATEVQLMKERFETAAGQLEKVFGKEGYKDFAQNYLRDLEAPGSTYFTQTFVVNGSNAKAGGLRLVKR